MNCKQKVYSERYYSDYHVKHITRHILHRSHITPYLYPIAQHRIIHVYNKPE